MLLTARGGERGFSWVKLTATAMATARFYKPEYTASVHYLLMTIPERLVSACTWTRSQLHFCKSKDSDVTKPMMCCVITVTMPNSKLIPCIWQNLHLSYEYLRWFFLRCWQKSFMDNLVFCKHKMWGTWASNATDIRRAEPRPQFYLWKGGAGPRPLRELSLDRWGSWASIATDVRRAESRPQFRLWKGGSWASTAEGAELRTQRTSGELSLDRSFIFEKGELALDRWGSWASNATVSGSPG